MTDTQLDFDPRKARFPVDGNVESMISQVGKTFIVLVHDFKYERSEHRADTVFYPSLQLLIYLVFHRRNNHTMAARG